MYETFEGYVSKSKSKVKCKKKENGKYKWNADELSRCITCDPEKLKFEDDSEGFTDPWTEPQTVALAHGLVEFKPYKFSI